MWIRSLARASERELCVCWNDEARIKTQHTRLMFVDGIQQRRQTMTVTAKIRSHRVQMYCVSFDHIVYECLLWCMCEVQAVVYSNGDCCRAKNQAIKGNSSRSHNSINFHFKRDFFLFVCSFAAFYSIHAKFRTHLNQCRHLHEGIVAGAFFLFRYLMNVGGNWKEKKTHTQINLFMKSISIWNKKKGRCHEPKNRLIPSPIRWFCTPRQWIKLKLLDKQMLFLVATFQTRLKVKISLFEWKTQIIFNVEII